LTDPDIIEVSNLNRQFLFREKNLRQPKSTTAAKSVIAMNPKLKGHITDKLDKIHAETSHIYNSDFYNRQDIIMNALDNIQARQFIDQKAIKAGKPLIDSGTLGTKGHVQVIIPGYSESYGSQKDADDTDDIPFCTLKMFPEETIHCVEWAKEIFGQKFLLKPQSYNKIFFSATDTVDWMDLSDIRQAQKLTKLHSKLPKTFYQCI
jgi:molybdopterin/thiamine biosynthesis adenylyltransferase